MNGVHDKNCIQSTKTELRNGVFVKTPKQNIFSKLAEQYTLMSDTQRFFTIPILLKGSVGLRSYVFDTKSDK